MKIKKQFVIWSGERATVIGDGLKKILLKKKWIAHLKDNEYRYTKKAIEAMANFLNSWD
jgi:hypothetical protein